MSWVKSVSSIIKLGATVPSAGRKRGKTQNTWSANIFLHIIYDARRKKTIGAQSSKPNNAKPIL
jgi:hypothetical protein